MAEQKKQPSAITPLLTAARTGVAAMASQYKSKYSVNTTLYPIDLFSNKGEYGDNYVVFYINVPEASKLITEGKVTTTDRDTIELGSTIARTIGELKTSKIGSGSAFTETNLGLSLRQNKRITDTVTLYTPNILNARYSMNYEAEDMVIANAAADVTNALMGTSSSQSTGIDKMKSAIGAGANIAMSKFPGGAAASAITGLAANPKKEQLFKNVDFRTFNFEYQFSPRSKQESDNVKKIIDLFKLHMHPEYKDTAGFLFLYPSEFEIVYYQGDSENMNLPRHTTSVLIDMSINYTPQGAYNTFDNGASTLITVNLTFKELAILTKAEMLDGF